MASGLLQKIIIYAESSQVCCSVLIHAPRNELLITSAGPDLQPIATTENTCPPLQETDPSCSGVMILNDRDILVQR